ncbi:MAG: hypothetical protein RLZZ397_1452 [Pseudomonadota bacterium]
MSLSSSSRTLVDPSEEHALIEARDSRVHGRGVFARLAIPSNTSIIEYTGQRITWKEAVRRHPHDPTQPHHTFYFHLESGRVIDAKINGNIARWINHSCEPNCEAREEKGRVYIYALRALHAGEELFYDYGLEIDARYTAKLKREYACYCGHATCRGTMLAPKSRSKPT